MDSGWQDASISRKFPCYDDQNNVIGVLGVSFDLASNELSKSLCYLVESGLWNANAYNLMTEMVAANTKADRNEYVFPQLSLQENTIVHGLVKGCTLKEIAYYKNLSVRTVEHYLSNIKNKLDVNSKFDVIKMYHQQHDRHDRCK